MSCGLSARRGRLVVLTGDKVRAVVQRLDGVPRLIAGLLYGAGLRVLDCWRLRVQDVDFCSNPLDSIQRGEVVRSAGVQTLVTVDVISGISARGIKGICLAKGIALNRSHEALKTLWFERDDNRS